MFIRQTRTNNSSTGEEYLTYRLVRAQRIAGKVRQVTILNLGRHFPVLREDWSLLCSRIEQLLAPQTLLCPLNLDSSVERARVGCWRRVWVGATTLNATAYKEEQHPQTRRQ